MNTHHRLPLEALGLGIALTFGACGTAAAIPAHFWDTGSNVDTDYTRSVDPSMTRAMVPIDRIMVRRLEGTRRLEEARLRAQLRAALEDDLMYDDPMEDPANTQHWLRTALADLSQPKAETSTDVADSRDAIAQALNDAKSDLYASVSAQTDPDSDMGG